MDDVEPGSVGAGHVARWSRQIVDEVSKKYLKKDVRALYKMQSGLLVADVMELVRMDVIANDEQQVKRVARLMAEQSVWGFESGYTAAVVQGSYDYWVTEITSPKVG